MDFKSLMSKQINKSKAQTTSSAASKYQRRGDAEKEREAKYVEEQTKLERERQEKLDKKRKYEEEELERSATREEKKRKLAEESKVRREAQEAEEDRLKRKRLGLSERPITTVDGEEQPDIADDELRTKLKNLKVEEEVEGETHQDRLVRFYRMIKALAKKRKWYPGPIPTILEPLPADELILPEKPPSADDKEACIKLHRQIASYLNFVLTEWSAALASRSPDDAQSSAGIAATNNYKIALEDLKPLMRRLEAGVYEPQAYNTIAMFGEHFTDRLEQEALLGVLKELERKHGWPVEKDAAALRREWQWEDEFGRPLAFKR